MAWPTTSHALIHSITPSMNVTSVTLLATGKPVTFDQQADGLHLDLPTQPAGVRTYVYRIEMKDHVAPAAREGDVPNS
jgi:alpha-L-fucosidase